MGHNEYGVFEGGKTLTFFPEITPPNITAMNRLLNNQSDILIKVILFFLIPALSHATDLPPDLHLAAGLSADVTVRVK